MANAPDPTPAQNAVASAGLAALDAVDNPSPETQAYAQQEVAAASARYEAALDSGLSRDQVLEL